MAYTSLNPYTEEELASFPDLTDDELQEKLDEAFDAHKEWKNTAFRERADVMLKIGELLENNKKQYATTMTTEMGKPLKQAIAEVEKCAWLCRYYAEHAEGFLSDKNYDTDYSKSMAVFEPLGVVYAVMPWNFPFWQAFRCAVPAIMAGNTIVLKHSSNVPQSAVAMEKIFKEAYPERLLLTNLFISHDQSEQVIAHPGVQGISLTGSEGAGQKIAGTAGKNLKRTVLELGGSDPFIVLPDADIEQAVKTGITARMQNNGQSCIAAKRFILHRDISADFIKKFVEGIKALKMGDPMDENTDIGPLNSQSAVEAIDEQVKDTTNKGGKLLAGGKRGEGEGFFYEPTVIIDIPQDSAAYKEEIFGPVASVFVVDSEEEAIRLANDTSFGLGASLWTQNKEKALQLARQISSGGVFINDMTKSNPHLPFGGIKRSGYGRELSDFGILEFVNIKTIAIA